MPEFRFRLRHTLTDYQIATVKAQNLEEARRVVARFCLSPCPLDLKKMKISVEDEKNSVEQDTLDIVGLASEDEE